MILVTVRFVIAIILLNYGTTISSERDSSECQRLQFAFIYICGLDEKRERVRGYLKYVSIFVSLRKEIKSALVHVYTKASLETVVASFAYAVSVQALLLR